MSMKMYYPELAEIVRRDPRYALEAYDFMFEALRHTQKLLGRLPSGEGDEPRHVSGQELVMGIRDYALREFGLMARTVFHMWGIDRTDDFGEIVFNLIESNLMRKTDQDLRDDFHNIFDLDKALMAGYEITLEQEE
ncbi:MAG: Minf_1886 family protein [Gemmataceae bacterium]